MNNDSIKRARREKNSASSNVSEEVLEEEKLIISEIDAVYMSFESEPVYFAKLRIITMLIMSIISFCMYQNIFIYGSPKNNTYCFDLHSSEFKICDYRKSCFNILSNQINKIIYLEKTFNNTEISNINIKTELLNVNKVFKQFFLKENLMFLQSNMHLFDKFKMINEDYSAIIQLVHKENNKIVNYFGILCEFNSMYYFFLIFFVIGLTIGAFFYGYLTDYLGRKKVLLISLFTALIGYTLKFIFCIIISQSSTSTADIPNNLTSFETLYKIDINYEKMKSLINSEYYTKYDVYTNFMKYKFLFFANLILTISGIIGASITTFCIAIECSISNIVVFKNYYYLYLGISIGTFTNFILISAINNLAYLYFVTAIMLLIIFIICFIYLKESPKYLFEHKEYKEITSFFEYVVEEKSSEKKSSKDQESLVENQSIKNKEKIEKFYVLSTDKKVKTELSKRKSNVFEANRREKNKIKCLSNLLNATTFLDFCGKIEEIKQYINSSSKKIDIDKDFILQHPLVLIYLSFINPRLTNKTLIIFALIICTVLINYLLLTSLNSSLLFSRDDVLQNYGLNNYILYAGFFTILGTYIFNFVFTFFGPQMILIICYSCVLFFMIFLTFAGKNPDLFYDRNLYYYNQYSTLFINGRGNFAGLFYMVIFFHSGNSHILILQICKYTYTLTRGTMFGMFFFIYSLIFLFSITINLIFDDLIIYILLLATIGLMVSIFIDTDDNKTIVCDYRTIKIDDI